MKISPSLVWKLEGDADETLDARLMPLLRAIATSRSLSAATSECGISYRSAWGMLRDYQRKLGEPLVLLERGRGARLSPSGEVLMDLDNTAKRRLARLLPGLAGEVSSTPSGEDRPQAPLLRIAASHDLALAEIANGLPGALILRLELSFMGSLHALKELAEGRADVAGFHVPISGRPGWDRTVFLRDLRERRDRLIRFVDRDQGLILSRGNRSKVVSLRDIAEQGLRFINRQRGSGTRLLVDQMLADDKIRQSDIKGYGKEEFTHRAVAATVASGGADAGFGLRAAAAEYRLAFVPLVRERYFLAVRAKALETAEVARMIEMLRSPAFAKIVHKLPGYTAEAAGTICGIDAIAAAGKG